ncbi:helix-turn-helix transcriptional regulator [Paraburkholderia sp. BCC1884]|uniref:helix-turn-helix transcriptional regulator n=1 Tax=Paraburkholderia sp. BCC1884 TaxID=2562668 RepID=UPI001183D4A2|nr:AraC family transcriptional regulator [Paraburkholderia sp. BCC1884]
MGKIAITLDQALARREQQGAPGSTAARPLAHGEGWNVADIVCTFGPHDRPFEERHAGMCIAMVASGSFGYRAATGRELLTPGSLLLGNPGDCFECGHRHGAGDRCIAFRYAPAYFERLAVDAGLGRGPLRFNHVRLPTLRALSPLIARACATAVTGAEQAGGDAPDRQSHRAGECASRRASDHASARASEYDPHRAAWHELAVELAVATMQAVGSLKNPTAAPGAAVSARVAQVIRLIDDTPGAAHTLTSLAAAAGLSEFYFLRTFQRVAGVTPHQYLLRARLRTAALRLRDGGTKVVDIAFDCGFNDLSNFNHAFRAEFAATPRAWRARGRAARA